MAKEKNRLDADHNAIQNLLDNDLPGIGEDNDEDFAVQLLERLRELGVIQVSNKRRCVFFHTIHNARPLIMYLEEMESLPQFEWVLPIHVYETVNLLMWKRLLEPKLALAYRGLFDVMPAQELGYVLSYTLSDPAFNYLCGLISKQNVDLP